MINSVIIKENDTVATTTVALNAGDKGTYLLHGTVMEVKLLEDIPQYHKYAIVDMRRGTPVYKYGEKMGIASKDISVGEYVHSHNVESERA